MGGHHPTLLGQLEADEEKMTSEATTFIAACYGSKVEGDIVTNLEAISTQHTGPIEQLYR